MWTVGDDVTHAAFLAALGSSHGFQGRVETWFSGALTSLDVEFESGAVKVSSRNRERRGLDLTVRESLWPTAATDLLTPFGAWCRAYVTITAGATRFPEIPVFAGKVMKPSRVRWSGQVQVTAVDPMWQINREHFEEIRSAPAGATVPAAILMLLTEVFPGATLDNRTGSTAVIPSGLLWSPGKGSRGRAVDELAASIGAELYARPTQVWPYLDAVLRPVPSLNDPVVWTFPDGRESIVAGDKLEQSGAGVVNRWIVTVERQDAPTISVPVTDDNPASPTRYGGPMGRLPDYLSSSLITSEGQAYAAGQAKLNQTLGLTRPRTVTVPGNPALDGGDVLAIGVDGETATRHIADDFTLALQADPPSMDITTRSTEEGE